MQAGKLHPHPEESTRHQEMMSQQELLSRWADLLHGWGIHQVAAALLEAAGPLNIIGAQLVYIGQPVLNGFLDKNSLSSLAWMLEERSQTKNFIQLLREDAR